MAVPSDLSELLPTPITHFSETEAMMAETVSKFAQSVVLPKAREMDEKELMDPAIVEACFEQGLMGIEIPEEYGGAGTNFTSAIVAIEELARVDPSVSVMVDVHATLCCTAMLKYGSEALKKEWLPKLATNTVGKCWRSTRGNPMIHGLRSRLTPSRIFLPFRTSLWIRCFRPGNSGQEDRERIRDRWI